MLRIHYRTDTALFSGTAHGELSRCTNMLHAAIAVTVLLLTLLLPPPSCVVTILTVTVLWNVVGRGKSEQAWGPAGV